MSTSAPKTPQALPDGVWKVLLAHAFRLIDDIERLGQLKHPFWTLGGGTVLMLRHSHRVSKDIDIFFPDPQYLGFVSPRLSDVAQSIAPDYVEGAGYIKLLRPEGEIDFVAATWLTEHPFELWELLGRVIKVETSAEIVAKKFFHRGDRATARDLFDLALVIEQEPTALVNAAPFLRKHKDQFIEQIHQRQHILEIQYNAIDRLNFKMSYGDALELVSHFFETLS